MYGKTKEPMENLLMISKLIDHGVNEIVAEFDGQGDSGEIHDLIYLDSIGQEVDPPICMEDYMYDRIEDLVNNYGGDWVNNDGGYGTIKFYVYEKTIDASYYQRTVDEYHWDSKEIVN